MSIETIEREFKEKVSNRLRLGAEGIDRFRVFTPFLFEDGDHLGDPGAGERGAVERDGRLTLVRDADCCQVSGVHLRFRQNLLRHRNPADFDADEKHAGWPLLSQSVTSRRAIGRPSGRLRAPSGHRSCCARTSESDEPARDACAIGIPHARAAVG